MTATMIEESAALAAPTPPAKRRPAWRHPAVRLGGSAIILALLITALPKQDLVTALKSVPPLIWPVAMVAYLSSHLVGVWKWRTLVNAAGAGLEWRDALRAYYGGLFGNTFLPSIVGGDVVRAGLAFNTVKSKSALVLGSLLDRIQDVVGLAAVAGIGALLSPRALDPQSRRIFLALFGVLALLGVGTLVAVAVLPVRKLPLKVRRMLVQIRRAVRATAGQPWAMVQCFLLGMLLQTLLVALNWWLGLSVGITGIPLYVWLFVWPLAKLSGLLPVTQGGIGVREAAQAVLFKPFGVAAYQAVATGLIFEAVLIGGGLLSGGISWLIGRSASRR